MQRYDGYSLARLLEEPEPLDVTGWHLVPTELGYSTYRWKEGVLFVVLAHGDGAHEGLVRYLLDGGATVGPKPEQDEAALGTWEAQLKSSWKT